MKTKLKSKLAIVALLLFGLMGASSTAQAQYFPKHKWFKDNGMGQYYAQMHAWNEWDYENVESPVGDTLYVIAGLSELLLDTKLSGDTASPDYWIAKGQVATNYRDEVEAERCYQKAISLGPKYAWGYYHLAYHYIFNRYETEKGQEDTFAMAAKLIEKALLAENHAYIHASKGRLLLKLGKLREATKEADLAWALDSTVTPVQVLRYEVYRKTSTPEENLKWANYFIKRFPNIYVYAENKCNFHLQLGQADSFYKTLDYLRQMAQKDLTVLERVAKRIQEFNNSPFACKMVIDYYQPNINISEVGKLLASNPNSPENLVLAAKAFYNDREVEKCFEYVYKVPLTKTETAHFALDLLYRMYSPSKVHDSTLAICARAIRIFPNSYEWHDRYILSLSKAGNRQELLKHSLKVTDMFPDKSNFDFAIAVTYYSMGQTEEAIPYISRAISKDPNSPQSFLLMSMCMHKRGNLEACGVYVTARRMGYRSESIYDEELEEFCIGSAR